MKKFNLIHVLIAVVVFSGVLGVVKNFYLQPSVGGGEKAPDFLAMAPGNKAFKLSDLRGQYVLVDFWGSWCGPCIAEIPELVGLYGKFQTAKFQDGEGFAIVSVAVEKDRERWLRALAKYQMPWPYHAIDPTSSLRFFNSPIAGQYGVKQLPTKFLVDPKGKIAAVDLSVAEIDVYLTKLKK